MDFSDGPVNVAGQWALDPNMQANLVNQLFVQFDSPSSESATQPDGAYLTFGHINPPVFSLAPGQQEPTPEMIANLILPVIPLARVYCTFDRLKAFANDLNSRIAAIEALEGPDAVK